MSLFNFNPENDLAKRGNLMFSIIDDEKIAFREIYNDLYGMIYHLSIHYLHDEHVSKEIVQDSFMKLWEIRDTVDDRFNVRNFLYTITKNHCLNYIRNQRIALKHQKNIKYLEMQINYDDLVKPVNYFEFEELRNKIDHAIADLPDNLRETFLLSRYEELHYKEIAEKQFLSIKTVESRMTKALQILRVDLREYLQ